jgi:hypothetical protein
MPNVDQARRREELIQHAEHALPHPERCRHTVWPVQVAATEDDIGVTMKDLAMGGRYGPAHGSERAIP